MSTRASYDELIKHVRSLEEENTHLRRELLFSSSGHLVSRIENDPPAAAPTSGRDATRQTVAAAANMVSTTGGHFSITDSYANSQSPPAMMGSLHESSSPDERSEGQGGHLMMSSTCVASASASRQVPLRTSSTMTSLTGDSGVSFNREHSMEQGIRRNYASVEPSHTGRDVTLAPSDTIKSSPQESLATHQFSLAASRLITIATQTSDNDLQDQLTSLELDADGFYGDQSLAPFSHGGWMSVDRVLNSRSDESLARILTSNDTASMRSFTSSTNAVSSSSCRVQQQLGTKVEVVYSLLSMLGTHDKDDMSQTLLAMSNSQDSCVAMRQSGCLKLLIQLLHDNGAPDSSSGQLGKGRGCRAARGRAAKALRNIVCANPDSQRSRREERVLRLLEQIRGHCDDVRGDSPLIGDSGGTSENRPSRHGLNDSDHHVGPAIAALMKLSFNEEYRTAIGTLGGLQAVAELLQLDNESCGAETVDLYSVTLRRYACMVLTNLTYGDVENKALLCSLPLAVSAIVAQLQSSDEDLRQVAASVLRNLSWRADAAGKRALREAGTVSSLTKASLTATKELTLKSILSALWNVSAHCSENKADVCAVPGSLSFLVDMLELHGSSSTPIIAENAGGVLCNVSSYIAVHEEHRAELRLAGALPILLRQLRSPSLTVVSNACGTLWNLSARCAEDQRALRDLGAIAMLRSLVNSRHRMIAMGSTAALKNLLLSSRIAPGSGSVERRNGAMENTDSADRHNPCQARGHPKNSDSENSVNLPSTVAEVTSGKDERSLMSSEQQRSLRNNVFYGQRDASDTPSAREVHPYPDVMQSRTFPGRGSDDTLKYSNGTFPSNGGGVEVMSRSAASSSGSFFVNPSDNHVGTHSVDSSPSVHRRHPFHGLLPSSQVYSANSSTAAFTSWSGNGVRAAPSKQSYSDDLNLSRLSRRAENVHLTDLNGDEDEPINFSIKYNVEMPQVTNSVRQTTTVPSQPLNRVPGMAQAQHQAGPVLAVHQLPTAAHQQSMSRQAFGHPGPAPMNSSGVNAMMRGIPPQGRYALRSERSIGDSDQIMNYSLQYAEQYDESGAMGYEKPLDYGARFMEPVNKGVPASNYQHKEIPGLRSGAQDTASFGDEDTLRTFCTEGTPMNYLSTATSMNDLSVNRMSGLAPAPSMRPRLGLPQQPAGDPAADEMKDFSSEYVEAEMAASAAATYKPDLNRTANIRVNPHVMQNMRGNVVVNQWSNQAAGGRTISSASSGRLIATEMCEDTEGLKAKVDSGPSSKASLVSTPKTVTFDVESNQVQETPMMFSRSSSLGSLSSFDAHSIHSSVISEYSVRASQVVSPSELPDSPCDTMPPSPSPRNHRVPPTTGPSMENDSKRPPGFFVEMEQNVVQEVDLKNQPGSDIAPKSDFNEDTLPSCGDYSDESSPMRYCDEGNMSSSRTSLSALTVDGEKIAVCKELRSGPLGEETSVDEAHLKMRSAFNDDQMAEDSLEEDYDNDNDSPVSEGEENLLAECISLAMPRGKSAANKTSSNIEKSNSQQQAGGGTRDLDSASAGNASSEIIPRVQNSQSLGSIGQYRDAPNDEAITVNAHSRQVHHEPDSGGFDSPRKFATEDTPLNYSQTGSLSDLSCLNDDGMSIGKVYVEQSDTSVNHKDNKLSDKRHSVSDDLDVSLSDEDSDDEELLSKVIEAAMPKSRKPWKPLTTMAVSQDTKSSMDSRSRQPVAAPIGISGGSRRHAHSLDPPSHRSAVEENNDRMKDFHNLRQTTVDARQTQQVAEKAKQSLRDQSFPLSSSSKSNGQNSLLNGTMNQKSVVAIQPQSFASSLPPLGKSSDFTPAEDHVLSYAVEDTPISFSRDLSPLVPRKHPNLAITSMKSEDRSWNSSLSSLSFDSSLNAEPTPAESALLEECINAAMPKNRGKKAYKKAANQPLRTSPSGSSESSLKRNPVTANSSSKDPRRLDHSITGNVPLPTNPARQHHSVSAPDRKLGKIVSRDPVLKPSILNPVDSSKKSSIQSERLDLSNITDADADITKETLPDVCPADITMDDDTLPSGPSTEANNTVIYMGPSTLNLELAQSTGPHINKVGDEKGQESDKSLNVLDKTTPIDVDEMIETINSDLIEMLKDNGVTCISQDEAVGGGVRGLEGVENLAEGVLSQFPSLEPSLLSSTPIDKAASNGANRKLSFDGTTRVGSPLSNTHESGQHLKHRRGSSSPVASKTAMRPCNKPTKTSVSTLTKSSPRLGRKSPVKSDLRPPSPLIVQKSAINSEGLTSLSMPCDTPTTLSTASWSDSDHDVPLIASPILALARFPGYRNDSCNLDASDRRYESGASSAHDKSINLPSSATFSVISEISHQNEMDTENLRKVLESKSSAPSVVLSDKELVRLALQSSAGLKFISPGKSPSRISSKSASSSPVSIRKSFGVASTKSNPQLNKLDLKDPLQEKKVVKSKISSLWKRDKESKPEKDKVDSKAISSTSNKMEKVEDTKGDSSKQRSREGLGKSPKSFRKSFPMRKSKKSNVVAATPEVQNPEISASGLTRSGTYNKLTADSVVTDNTGNQVNLKLPCVDVVDMRRRQDIVSDELSKTMTTVNGKEISLDAFNDESSNTTVDSHAKASKKRGILKLLGIESKSKSKLKDDLYSTEADHSTTQQQAAASQKKKGFFWRKDTMIDKKSEKDKPSVIDSRDDTIWVKHRDGRVIKSATLPSGSVSIISADSFDVLPAEANGRKVIQSATIHSLFPTEAVLAVTDDESCFVSGTEPLVILRQHSMVNGGSEHVDLCTTLTDCVVDDHSASSIVTTV